MRSAKSAQEIADQADEKGYRDEDFESARNHVGTAPDSYAPHRRRLPRRAGSEALVVSLPVRRLACIREHTLVVLAPEELASNLGQRVVGIDNDDASRTLRFSHLDHLPTGSAAAGLLSETSRPRGQPE